MATRAKYTRVRQDDKRQEKPDTDILMRFSPTYGRYVTRALTLFFGENKTFVTVKAADRLMDRALWVAEVIKKRVPGIHQITQIKEREIVDVYEPKQQGLVRVEQKRFLTIIEVTLTKQPTAQQKNAPGYQAPIQGKQEDYLTKDKWLEQESQRKERGGNRGQRRERGQRGQRRERGQRGERGQGQRKERGQRRTQGNERRERGDRNGRGEERRRGGRN